MNTFLARRVRSTTLQRGLRAALSCWLLAIPACGDDASAGGGGGGVGGAPISDATELDCPNPGLLPFRTESSTFADPDNQLVAEGSPRNKDEASDTLGLPGGVRANTYFAVDEAGSTADVVYEGKKARTGQNSGLSSVPLGGEAVSLWYYDPASSAWMTLGRTSTDDVGQYTIAPDAPIDTELGRPVYSILEADGTCSAHHDYLLPAGSKVIVADIDGTLTLSDDEFLQQIDDGTYVPVQNGAADTLMTTWAQKGYVTIYLSARPHTFRSETRTWLEQGSFPTGPVITANSLVVDETARAYKASWLTRMRDDFQWDIVAVYGNADSDIAAYEDAGIPKEVTFIIGPLAGDSGTQAIADNDYTAHITAFVEPQPDL